MEPIKTISAEDALAEIIANEQEIQNEVGDGV